MSTALWVLGVAIFEETMELAAGHVEGALLIFGRAAGDERSVLVIEGCAQVEDIMGKQRTEQPPDSIFANNPFLDGLFEWMDSPEGQQSIEVRDVLWNWLIRVKLLLLDIAIEVGVGF